MSEDSPISLYSRITIMAESLVPVVRTLRKEIGIQRADEIIAGALEEIGRGWGAAINEIEGDGLAERLAKAAEKVGIRLVLLHTAYHRNGPLKPASDQQKRFVFPSVDAFLDHLPQR